MLALSLCIHTEKGSSLRFVHRERNDGKKTFAANCSVCVSKFLRMEAALRGQSHFANRIAPEASYFLPGQL
jgi:hypothetical protein